MRSSSAPAALLRMVEQLWRIFGSPGETLLILARETVDHFWSSWRETVVHTRCLCVCPVCPVVWGDVTPVRQRHPTKLTRSCFDEVQGREISIKRTRSCGQGTGQPHHSRRSWNEESVTGDTVQR